MMKRTVIFLLAMFVVTFAQAQKVSGKEVPTAVKSVLQKNYPKVKGVKWEKEGNNYEAKFEVDKTEYSLLLDVSGNILETEIEIKVDALPAQVKGYVAKNYAGQKIKEAAKITDDKGVVTYEAEIKGKDLIFNEKGTFIKEVTE